jgi:hypothetical protein
MNCNESAIKTVAGASNLSSTALTLKTGNSGFSFRRNEAKSATQTEFRSRNTAFHSNIDAVNTGTKFWILLSPQRHRDHKESTMNFVTKKKKPSGFRQEGLFLGGANSEL